MAIEEKRSSGCLTRLLVILLLAAGATLLALRFGNPQWHKFVYMFQAYVSPKGEPSSDKTSLPKLNPPPDYTGTWRRWFPSGKIWTEESFVGGKKFGRAVEWKETGEPAGEGWYIGARRVSKSEFEKETKAPGARR